MFFISCRYDSSVIRYDSASTNLATNHSTGTIRLLGLVKPDKKYVGIPKVADLTFTGLLSTSVSFTVSNVKMADKAALKIPAAATPAPCALAILGNYYFNF